MNRKSFLSRMGVGLGMFGFSGILKATDNPSVSVSSGNLKPKIIRQDEGTVLNVIGDIQTHKISGKDTGNQVVEWINEVKPGTGIPPHIHTKEDEIFRVLKGKVEIMVGGEVTILEAGDTAFAPKDIVHAWKVVGEENASMCTTAFPAGIEAMFQELNDLPAGPPDFAKVSEICGRYGIQFV